MKSDAPKASDYAHPEVLVSTAWVAEHLDDPAVRIVESNEDVLLYDVGHIPGSVHIDWRRDLNDQTIRDYIQPKAFAELCAAHGIGPDTTVVFYGDKANWWACYAFWVFTLFDHPKLKIMDGGRDRWIDEGRDVTRERPEYPRCDYPVPAARKDREHRAFFPEALAQSQSGGMLIDVRSPAEFRGEVTHMPGYPQEGVLRGGHIPGAHGVPWKSAVYEDGTFKSREELEQVYGFARREQPGETVITYCRIGERSSHTWFVLKYLIGIEQVRNYDGSWTEWGNQVGAPIETGSGPKRS